MYVPPVHKDFNVFARVKVHTLILWATRQCSVLGCAYILKEHTTSIFRHPDNGGNISYWSVCNHLPHNTMSALTQVQNILPQFV